MTPSKHPRPFDKRRPLRLSKWSKLGAWLPLFVLVVADKMEIHGFVFATLHEQPISVVTETEPVTEAEVCETLLDARPNVQAAPDCVTIKFCPAMPTTPVRASPVGFASRL